MNSSLLEPKIINFISFSLKECKQFKERNLNFFFNAGMTILFIIIIGGFLYYKYKGKLTNKQIMERNLQNYQYIISKIQNISLEKQKLSNDLITNLPSLEKY